MRNSIQIWDSFKSLSHSASQQIAIAAVSGNCTFEKLYCDAEMLAREFAKIGVERGDIVALALPNSTAFVVSFLALCKLDTVIALVSPQYRDIELKAITIKIKPRHFIMNQRDQSRIGDILHFENSSAINSGPTALQICGIDIENRLETTAIYTDDADLETCEGLALIKFSGGTTGVPKAIGLTASNIIAEAQNVHENLNINSDDKILAVVPIFHSYGFDLGVLGTLISGSTLILRDSFIPRQIMAEIQDNTTIFLGVPSMYKLLAETQFSKQPDLSGTRYLLSCTAPLSTALVDEFSLKFGAPICQHYGSSETGAVATHLPHLVLEKKNSVGKICSRIRVDIIDGNGRKLPQGHEGELLISGETVAKGYLMGKPHGKSPFESGSFKIGDLGKIDDDGFIFLNGRVDNVINVGGLKVSPFQVAMVLESHPEIREAAVLGVKDSMGQEIVYAAVSLKSKVSEEAILEFCRERLAEYKIPRRIDILEKIPRGPSGKINLRPEDIKL